MRRWLLLSLIILGVLLITPLSVLATDNLVTGSFTEDHVQGDHYKTTDVTSTGDHGYSVGGFQISSALLKSLAAGNIDPTKAYGYVQGDNPFTTGTFNTDMTLIPPLYTLPCPSWVANTQAGGPTLGDDGKPGLIGDCLAQNSPTDPQTNPFTLNVYIPGYGWILLAENDLAEVLDDLYQRVGANDSEMTGGTKKVRYLDQTFDTLFYMKDENPLAANGYYSVSGKLFFDETLDQDIADYINEYAGTNTSDPLLSTVGIFGKLTNLFSFDQSQNPVEYIDQWLVSDMYDILYLPGNDPALTDKFYGEGALQGYSSWFMKNDPFPCPNINGEGPCTYTYRGGHGSITKTVSGLTNHTDIDP